MYINYTKKKYKNPFLNFFVIIISIFVDKPCHICYKFDGRPSPWFYSVNAPFCLPELS